MILMAFPNDAVQVHHERRRVYWCGASGAVLFWDADTLAAQRQWAQMSTAQLVATVKGTDPWAMIIIDFLLNGVIPE